MSINSRCGRTDTAVRAGIAARLAEMQARADNATDGPWETYGSVAGDWPLADPRGDFLGCSPDDGVRAGFDQADAEFIAHARSDVPALTNAVESVLDYVARCEESGITMQPGDVRRLIAAALGGAS